MLINKINQTENFYFIFFPQIFYEFIYVNFYYWYLINCFSFICKISKTFFFSLISFYDIRLNILEIKVTSKTAFIPVYTVL